MPVKVSRVHGVDFSGAVDAGRKIWIASGVAEGDALRIEACRPAEALPGSGREREAALRVLTRQSGEVHRLTLRRHGGILRSLARKGGRR